MSRSAVTHALAEAVRTGVKPVTPSGGSDRPFQRNRELCKDGWTVRLFRIRIELHSPPKIVTGFGSFAMLSGKSRLNQSRAPFAGPYAGCRG